MNDDARSLATVPDPGHPLVRLARALGRAFAVLGGMLIAPLARVFRGSRPTPAAPDLDRSAAPVPPAKPTTSGPRLPERLPTGDARAPSARARPEFECVVAEPAFTEARHQAAFVELQRAPGSKLLDLRAVQTIPFALFGRLVDAWTVGRETVPRLGIVLGYEHWVVFHAVAARRLQPIARRGIEVEIFYAQQLPNVPAWFAGDRVDHPLSAILEWLRAEWQPTAIWAQVLDTTAMLVTGFGHREQVPDQLLQLAAIALSLRGVDAATQAAKLVQTAQSWIGETPSRMRCRALRALASAMLIRGETEQALAQLDTAISVAALIRDPVEEASALGDVGTHALHHGHFARAEVRFRGALALLSADDRVLAARVRERSRRVG